MVGLCPAPEGPTSATVLAGRHLRNCMPLRMRRFEIVENCNVLERNGSFRRTSSGLALDVSRTSGGTFRSSNLFVDVGDALRRIFRDRLEGDEIEWPPRGCISMALNETRSRRLVWVRAVTSQGRQAMTGRHCRRRRSSPWPKFEQPSEVQVLVGGGLVSAPSSGFVAGLASTPSFLKYFDGFVVEQRVESPLVLAIGIACHSLAADGDARSRSP